MCIRDRHTGPVNFTDHFKVTDSVPVSPHFTDTGHSHIGPTLDKTPVVSTLVASRVNHTSLFQFTGQSLDTSHSRVKHAGPVNFTGQLLNTSSSPHVDTGHTFLSGHLSTSSPVVTQHVKTSYMGAQLAHAFPGQPFVYSYTDLLSTPVVLVTSCNWKTGQSFDESNLVNFHGFGPGLLSLWSSRKYRL